MFIKRLIYYLYIYNIISDTKTQFEKSNVKKKNTINYIIEINK